MTVGITGHQQLEDPSMWEWVESAMRSELASLEMPLTAVTSLAIGADQLLATLVRRRGGEIHAVIPFSGYERTFDDAHLHTFRELLSEAVSVEVLETPGTDQDAYLAAGKRVVGLADVMIAVWNGESAKGKGGTADIVAHARERGIPLIHINPLNQTVTHDARGVC